MAILDKIHKVIPYIETAAGYIKYAFRAQDVLMEDNTDLETKIKDLVNRLDKDYYLAYGTWYANNTVIPLSDSYLNYRDIIIRTGWNSQNGGLRDNRLSINGNGTILFQVIPIYQGLKYLGGLVVEFNPATPKQIKIVQSSGLNSSNATNGIRSVMGRSKLS